ncbi:hypothetical protein ACFQS2_05150 [Brachybacterium sp. GCM10030267]|uniref:hypothetical protein n=1 Tax=unclassified Brachybacterium TaxID=2623841 RepID=UPI003606696C
MAFKGMNPDEGRDTAQLVDEAGTVVNDLTDTRTSAIMGVAWVGPDYDSFTEDWNAFLSGPLANLSDAYNQKAKELTQHAEEQDTTSNQ